MGKRFWSFLTICVFAVSMAFAQQKVTGIVIEAETGEPVIGASIRVKGANIGVASNNDGKFTLEVPSSSETLVISYIGMKTKEVVAKSSVRVLLESNSRDLEDVVVTALGIKRSAKSLGYSATQIKADVITETRSSDIMSSLAGKVAGVQINTATSPGASNSVVVRGYQSIGRPNQPLYVIDGVPMINEARFSDDGLNSGFDYGSGVNDINPDDIESQTILKGAAATALYGSRAANGVVMITTKSGSRQNKGLGVEYNGGVTWESVLRVPQAQNRFGMGWYGDKTDDENGSWGPAFDGSTLKYGSIYDNSQQIKSYLPIKNNISDFFDTGVKYQNSVSVNGASNDNNSKFFLSLSHVDEDGIVPTDADSYKRYTISFRGSHKIKDLTISTALNYVTQNTKAVITGQKESSMYNAIMQTPRDISIVEYKDLSNPFHTPGYYYTPYGITNPYWILNNYKNEIASERFYGKIQFDYDFLKYFKATYRLGIDSNTNHEDTGTPNFVKLFGDSYLGQHGASTFEGVTGLVRQRTTRSKEVNHDAFVTFDMQATPDIHVNAIAGFGYMENKSSYLQAQVTGLTIPTRYDLTNSTDIPKLETYIRNKRMVGVYGQAEVSWKDMVFVTATARNDFSSTLPKENRSYFYSGITGSFIFSELLKPEYKKIITFGKFRAAWGKTGSDAPEYSIYPVFVQGQATSSGWGESNFPLQSHGLNAYSVGNTLGSENLSPEMTYETEFGLNMAFLGNRVSFDFAYYNRVTDGQILGVDTDPAVGYSRIITNFGKVRNRGVELLISGTPVKKRNFSWDLRFNFTKNKNKVYDLPASLGGEVYLNGFSGGTSIYAIEGEEIGVFKAVTCRQTSDGRVIVDENGLPVSSGVQKIGSINPKFTMGFGTTVHYKSFSLSADFDYRKGGLMYSRTRNIMNFTGNSIQSAYNNRNPWIIPNSVVEVVDDNGAVSYVENTTPLTPTNIYNYWNNGGVNLDAGELIEKTYVKLRSVSLAWDLPKHWLVNTFLADVRLSVFGNNLLMWTPKSNTFVDPEATSFGNDLDGQFGEYSTNPSSRRFGFNVQVKF